MKTKLITAAAVLIAGVTLAMTVPSPGSNTNLRGNVDAPITAPDPDSTDSAASAIDSATTTPAASTPAATSLPTATHQPPVATPIPPQPTKKPTPTAAPTASGSDAVPISNDDTSGGVSRATPRPRQ